MRSSARYHMDSHVVKIILEGVQMLSTVNQIYGYKGCYKSTHVNHPMTQWATKSLGNYMWLRQYVVELNIEWKFRFKHTKNHKSIDALETMQTINIPALNWFMTPMPVCMPIECQLNPAINSILPIESYRNYYQTSKQHLAKWTNRPVPSWYTYTGVNTIETRKSK